MASGKDKELPAGGGFWLRDGEKKDGDYRFKKACCLPKTSLKKKKTLRGFLKGERVSKKAF